jgi:hypothetical protein
MSGSYSYGHFVGELGIWHDVVSILSYGVYSRGIVVRFPVGARDFFQLEVQTGSTAHQTSYSAGEEVHFLGGKAAGIVKLAHSTPSSADSKNECNYKSTFSYAFMTRTETSLP